MSKFALSFLLLLCPVMLAQAQSQPGHAPPAGAMRPVAVIVAPVQQRALSDHFEVLATLLANESVAISSSVSDTVSRLAFEDGAHVEKGQVLLELTHAAESADLRAAQALLAEKRTALTRFLELHAQALASDAELDLARAQMHSAQADVEALQADVDDRILRAPFAGILGMREVSPGAYVQAGQRITSLHDLSVLKLEFDVPATQLAAFDGPVELQARLLNGPDEVFAAVLDSQDVALNAQTRSLRMRARLAQTDPRLHPGGLMLVEVLSRSRDALLIPEAAVIPRENRQIVYVHAGGKAELRELTLGQRRNGLLEVLSGLTASDVVVVHGGDKLHPGTPLQVMGTFDGSVPISSLIRQKAAQP
jgi:membrane fusion protein (multidrug efflux system)